LGSVFSSTTSTGVSSFGVSSHPTRPDIDQATKQKAAKLIHAKRRILKPFPRIRTTKTSILRHKLHDNPTIIDTNPAKNKGSHPTSPLPKALQTGRGLCSFLKTFPSFSRRHDYGNFVHWYAPYSIQKAKTNTGKTMRNTFLQGALIVSLLVGVHSTSHARSLRKVHTAWETIQRANLVQAYYCAGILGDLYRAKIYSLTKTNRYATALRTLVIKQKAILRLLSKQGNRRQRRYYRQLHATADLVLLTLDHLRRGLPTKQFTDYFKYRKAAATALNKMLSNRMAKRRKHYRGGWKKGLLFLGHQLTNGMAFGYLTVGLMGDGYFLLLLNKNSLMGYLKPTLQLLKANAIGIQQATKHVPATDRTHMKQCMEGYIELVQQATALYQFATTRHRKFLKLYQLQRNKAFQTMRSLNGR
jgi:hypothetical protein